MGYVVGFVLALSVSVFAWAVGFDRDRAFYPTVLVVTASYYVLFAVMGGSTRALILETSVMSMFVCAAVLGFKLNVWLVVIAFAGHGVFDFVRSDMLVNAGVPEYWPPFCLAFDLAAGGFLAWRAIRFGIGSPDLCDVNKIKESTR